MNKCCLFQDVHKSMFDGFRWTDLHPHFDRTLILRQRYPRRDIRCIDHCLIKMNLFTQPTLLYIYILVTNKQSVIGSINTFTVYTICYNQPCLITRHFGEDFFCGHVAVTSEIAILYWAYCGSFNLPKTCMGASVESTKYVKILIFPLIAESIFPVEHHPMLVVLWFFSFSVCFPYFAWKFSGGRLLKRLFLCLSPLKVVWGPRASKICRLGHCRPIFFGYAMVCQDPQNCQDHPRSMNSYCQHHELFTPDQTWDFHWQYDSPRMKKSTMKPLRILVLIVFLLHLRREPGAWANHVHVFPGSAWLPWVYV